MLEIIDKKVIESPIVKGMIEATDNMWRMGWDERNGGNISYLLMEDEIIPYIDTTRVLRTLKLNFPVPELAGKYFLVTGSGKYFKNVKNNPSDCLGIIQVSDCGSDIDILWGLENDGQPTSELPSHFMSHIARLEVDPNHRVIMHNHATNLLAMTFTHELDENEFTRTLWQMCTECVVVFPHGVGILPWMIPGTDAIGKKTAEKMKEFELVVWPHHGVFGAGATIDETFGLIETAEKAAQIYTIINSHQGGVMQVITDAELLELAKAFGVTPKSGVLKAN
ncbi:rhamnulose-1-phosphate aldolase [Evansella sp. AB-P1]|uniref:rhamnulose-1-phosphate aldolase n=1 Tax=Evansella sp. AB-P1 TaxID=3037653 RepID=UPI00241FB7C4|nr:rhamnulose-1-phosphate aldolase [Evansella sp. AB-P1]MDG5789722.1 rhamnulose-1-phosphate aldolase [Evansella sp. AB-P1]